MARPAVEYFEGGDLITVLLHELTEAGHHLLCFVFRLHIPPGSEYFVLAHLVYRLLITLLRLHESIAQIGIVKGRYRFSYKPPADRLDGRIVEAGIFQSCCFPGCLKLPVGVERVYDLLSQLGNGVSTRHYFYFLCLRLCRDPG